MGSSVACGQDNPRPPTATTSGVPISGDFSGTGPGTLRSAESLPTVDRRITRLTSTAARITYESTSGVDGSTVLVSGTVFAPVGPAPSGGWPIVAYGHGTTGVQHECAPSLSPSLLGAADAVGILVKDGYVVVMPDYQGLGLDDTYHPYLDAATVGHNMVDGVRAARKLIPGTSQRGSRSGRRRAGRPRGRPTRRPRATTPVWTCSVPRAWRRSPTSAGSPTRRPPAPSPSSSSVSSRGSCGRSRRCTPSSISTATDAGWRSAGGTC